MRIPSIRIACTPMEIPLPPQNGEYHQFHIDTDIRRGDELMKPTYPSRSRSSHYRFGLDRAMNMASPLRN